MRSRSFKLALFALMGLAVGCAATSRGDTDSQSMYDSTTGVPEANTLPVQWDGNGSNDCRDHVNADPTLTKFKYDENTWIIRENKCLNYEGNFIHVLFGTNKVLIQDTGSIPRDWSGTAGQAKFLRAFPIRDTIEGLITEWLAAHPNADGTPRTRDSMELLVTHSHSHGDHVQGDYQFKQANGQPYPFTKIAGYRPTDVATFFGLTDWPNKPGVLDLGNRKLEVLPIPGHEASHVAIYDHGSHLLLTGDSIYPGHIFIADWNSYRASMQRLETFLSETGLDGTPARPVVHVFGTHIEKAPEPRKFYPYGATVHEPERKLELDRATVKLIATTMQNAGTSPRRIMLDEVSLEP